MIPGQARRPAARELANGLADSGCRARRQPSSQGQIGGEWKVKSGTLWADLDMGYIRTSAFLAYLWSEPGAELVKQSLANCAAMSAVNFAEVFSSRLM